MAIAASLLLGMTALPAAASAEVDGNYTYTVSNNQETITAYEKTAVGEVVIPETLDGYSVVAINFRALRALATMPSSIAGHLKALLLLVA